MDDSEHSRPHFSDFKAMHAQPGGAYAEACRQLRENEQEIERLRGIIERRGTVEQLAQLDKGSHE